LKPSDTIYRGERRTDRGRILGTSVTVTRNGVTRELTLQPSMRVWSHSPTGFEWGYCGSGPAQLALALVLDVLGGDRETAAACYQWFKAHVVAGWGERWEITAGDVLQWVERWEREEAQRAAAPPIPVPAFPPATGQQGDELTEGGGL
jgi:hypothetical protein